jgi:hypothetical protein
VAHDVVADVFWMLTPLIAVPTTQRWRESLHAAVAHEVASGVANIIAVLALLRQLVLPEVDEIAAPLASLTDTAQFHAVQLQRELRSITITCAPAAVAPQPRRRPTWMTMFREFANLGALVNVSAALGWELG